MQDTIQPIGFTYRPRQRSRHSLCHPTPAYLHGQFVTQIESGIKWIKQTNIRQGWLPSQKSGIFNNLHQPFLSSHKRKADNLHLSRLFVPSYIWRHLSLPSPALSPTPRFRQLHVRCIHRISFDSKSLVRSSRRRQGCGQIGDGGPVCSHTRSLFLFFL